MSDWATFFAMGGYAQFVWPAYALSIAALTALAWASWRQMKRAERLVKLTDDPAPKP